MPKSMLKVAAVLLAAVAVAACSSDRKPAPGTSGNQVPSASSSSSSSSSSTSASTGSATLKVIATEPAAGVFFFDTGGVTSVPAGPVEITLSNRGTMTHELRLVRIRDLNFDAYKAAVAAQGLAGGAPLADDVGGPGSVAAGQSSSTTVTLTPGTYALVCFLTAPDGKVFAQHGMIARLEAS